MNSNQTVLVIGGIIIILLIGYFFYKDHFQSIGLADSTALIQFYNYPGNITNESLLGGFVPPYLTLPDKWSAPGSVTAYKLSNENFIQVLTNKAQCPNDRKWFQIKQENGQICGYCSH